MAMSSVDYRRYAAELLAIADHVGDHQSRAALLAMAQRWQHLAAQAEKNLQTVLVCESQSCESVHRSSDKMELFDIDD
jgi:hypothetical protein